MTILLSFLTAFAAGGDPGALERGLSAIEARNIAADVTFLASDELEGRDTPSAGLRLAARYLRARLERLGFEPSGDHGFFDVYRLERRGVDTEQCRVWITRDGPATELAFGPESYVFRGGTEHQFEGRVTFVGSASESDLRGLKLDGRWALVVEGSGGDRRRSWAERGARLERLRAAGALGMLTATSAEATPEQVAERTQSLERLAQSARRPRLQVAGGDDEQEPELPVLSLAPEVAALLFEGQGVPVAGQDLGVRLKERRVLSTPEVIEVENVAGLWRGSDPELSDEVIILSAHYDHVGVQDGVVYNGADDNGSGTSGLLAVAEALAHYGPLRRSVLILWVSGEEKGLLGSEAWTREPTLPEGLHAVCDLNIDMIGRNAPEQLMITPSSAREEYNGLVRLAESLAPLEGFPKLGSADEFWERSDHHNFAERLKIPVAFLFSGEHEDYHQPGDDAEKIDSDKIRRVARLVARMLDALQEDELQH